MLLKKFKHCPRTNFGRSPSGRVFGYKSSPAAPNIYYLLVWRCRLRASASTANAGIGLVGAIRTYSAFEALVN